MSTEPVIAELFRNGPELFRNGSFVGTNDHTVVEI